MKTFVGLNDPSEIASRFFRFGIAVIVLAFLVVLNIVPYFLDGMTGIKPDLFLIALFYWATHRPSLVPLWATFIVGLIFDSFSGLPLGLSSFVFILIRKIVTSQRNVLLGQSHLVFWAAFSFVCLIMNAVKLGVFWLLAGYLPELENIVFSVLLTIAVFPSVIMLLILTHRYLPLSDGEG